MYLVKFETSYTLINVRRQSSVRVHTNSEAAVECVTGRPYFTRYVNTHSFIQDSYITQDSTTELYYTSHVLIYYILLTVLMPICTT
jgi:hypothetical protein